MADRSPLALTVLRAAKKQETLRPGDRVGAAVSGGADSVALLLLLLELRKKLGIVLSVVHFNHNLRGNASDADEQFVAQLAAKHGLAFHVERANVSARAKREKANLEDTARRARYEFFEKLRDEDGVDRIAVAHTSDDQAETVLAHILRGAGIAGLGGIHSQRKGVVRPLLGVRRKDLRAYLHQKKQSWREDTTNQDTTRMRARIRKKLLPILEKQFNPGIVSHLSTLAELARRDEAFLQALARERCDALVRQSVDRLSIQGAELLRPLAGTVFNAENTEFEGSPVREAICTRMIRVLARRIRSRRGELTAQHVEAVLDLARSGQNGKSLQLPGGLEVRREENTLVFTKGDQGATQSGERKPHEARTYEYNIELAPGDTQVKVAELGCVFRFRVIDWPPKRGETSRDAVALDRDRLRSPILLRNWRPGDRLRPQGHRSTHKLKRLLNEKRVSRWERDGWPVLASGGVLVWARGFPVAAEFAANEGTRAGIVMVEEKI
ncbi:MAG TPA: tRNA lysidine(34) synthetase TilS [Candidatus Acidoferrum sp.]